MSNDQFDHISDEVRLQREYDSLPVVTFDELRTVVDKWLLVVDPGLVKVVAAQMVANRLPSDPVWMFLIAPSGGGKCLGRGTPVMMFDGSIKNVEDIIVGDVIMGDDSTPRNVLSLARGTENLYKIHQSRSDSYIVNESHILSLTYRNSRKEYKNIQKGSIFDIPLKEYLGMSKYKMKLMRGYRTSVEFQQKDVTLDPYFIGAWLGDGNSKNPAITTQDKEMIDFIHKFATSYNLRVSLDAQPNRCVSYWIVGNGGKGKENPVTHELRKYNLIGNKHIPDAYKTNHSSMRLAVLAGLLDTDGYLGENRRFEFVNKNERLARDVLFLARSLGFSASIRKVQKSIKSRGFVGTYWSVGISGDIHIIPTKIQRKQASPRKTRCDSTSSTINVEHLGVGEYFGFTIDGNHRFVLGDCTVTHNTEIMNGLLKCPDFYQLSQLTPNTLLSGMKNKEKETSLLKRLPPNTTIGFKDFTSLLDGNKDEFKAIMGQFRDLYDGRMVKVTGTGDEIKWEGKVGFLAGCTPIIEQRMSSIGAMGERFLNYKITSPPRKDLRAKMRHNIGREGNMREEIQIAYAGYLKGISIPSEIPLLPDEVDATIEAMADFIAACRAIVMRGMDSKREIEYIVEPEGTGRTYKQLYAIALALYIMNGNAWHPEDDYILKNLAISSIHSIRFNIIKCIMQYTTQVKTSTVAMDLGYPTSTARRYLEDLGAISMDDGRVRILHREHQGKGKPDLWTISTQMREILAGMGHVIEATKADDNFLQDEDDAPVGVDRTITASAGPTDEEMEEYANKFLNIGNYPLTTGK